MGEVLGWGGDDAAAAGSPRPHPGLLRSGAQGRAAVVGAACSAAPFLPQVVRLKDDARRGSILWIPAILGARTLAAKLFWVALLLACSAGCLFHLEQILERYFQATKVSKIRVGPGMSGMDGESGLERGTADAAEDERLPCGDLL